jgi:prepilin-type N-terminal cleavage/methylation domain-containing protein
MIFDKSNSQGGFTLLEIMVGIALLGVLSLVIIDQSNQASQNKRESDQNAIITTLNDRILVELSKRSTCTANFATKNTSPTSNITDIKDSEGNVIVASNTPYGAKVGGNSLSSANANAVQVGQITIGPSVRYNILGIQQETNPNEIVVSIPFTRKKGVNILFWSKPTTLTMPITVEQTGGAITSCYNDITNSITSAIRMSCTGNSSKFTLHPAGIYNEYGICEHNVLGTSCPAGQYLKKLQTAGGEISFTCASISIACPTNQVLTGFAANGSAVCAYPFKQCANGQMMIRSASGPYICLQTDSGCSGLYAVKSFNADGSVSCAMYYPPRTCTGLVRSISPDGTTTCDPYIKSVTCPSGYYVSSVDGSQQPVCTQFYPFPQSCGAGYGVYGMNSSGTILCQPLDRKLSCNGSYSASNKFSTCTAFGGTIMNRNGGTNSFCKFASSSCPGGFSQCPTYATTVDTYCTDTNSACAYSVSSRWAYGSNVFTTPVTPASTQCYYWARNAGPWNRSCTPYNDSVATTPRTEIGCY